MMDTVQKIIEEMKECTDPKIGPNTGAGSGLLLDWANRLEALMREPVGKVLSDNEMDIGFDRRHGPVIWFGTPQPGLLFTVPQEPK